MFAVLARDFHDDFSTNIRIITECSSETNSAILDPSEFSRSIFNFTTTRQVIEFAKIHKYDILHLEE